MYGFCDRCKSELAKDHVATEAIAYLRSIYAGVGVEAGKSVSQGSSAQFELQDVFCRPWGTTAELSIASYSPEELHRAWESIKAKPDPDKYETAILSSYG